MPTAVYPRIDLLNWILIINGELIIERAYYVYHELVIRQLLPEYLTLVHASHATPVNGLTIKESHANVVH